VAQRDDCQAAPAQGDPRPALAVARPPGGVPGTRPGRGGPGPVRRGTEHGLPGPVHSRSGADRAGPPGLGGDPLHAAAEGPDAVAHHGQDPVRGGRPAAGPRRPGGAARDRSAGGPSRGQPRPQSRPRRRTRCARSPAMDTGCWRALRGRSAPLFIRTGSPISW
jgi:hypothetical protein